MVRIDRNGRIGDNVQAARGRVGLSLPELSDALGISLEHLEAVEAGSGVDSVLLFDLCRELGVSPEEILREAPSSRREAPERSDPHIRWGIQMLEQIAAAERLVARYRL